MTNFPSTRTSDTYFYDSQLRGYIIQFMAVFAGLQVTVGEDDFEKESNLVDVTVRYGSADRVVNAIKSENTTNKPIRLPTMAAYLDGIQLAPDARKGVGVVQRYTHLERGKAFPTNLKVVQREMPIPYNAIFTLSILASNSNQHFQILEQLLMLFNPILQLQTSDDVHDWKRITTLELTDIGLSENYPIGADSRLIETNLTFLMPINLAPPTEIRKNIVMAIKLRLDAIANASKIEDVVMDVTREFPTYETIISANSIVFPKS